MRHVCIRRQCVYTSPTCSCSCAQCSCPCSAPIAMRAHTTRPYHSTSYCVCAITPGQAQGHSRHSVCIHMVPHSAYVLTLQRHYSRLFAVEMTGALVRISKPSSTHRMASRQCVASQRTTVCGQGLRSRAGRAQQRLRVPAQQCVHPDRADADVVSCSGRQHNEGGMSRRHAILLPAFVGLTSSALVARPRPAAADPSTELPWESSVSAQLSVKE